MAGSTWRLPPATDCLRSHCRSPARHSRLLKNSRGPRCARRRAGCEEWRGRRCGTSATSRDDADGPAPPQPFGQQGFALASFVVRRQRWTRIASSSRLAGERRSLLRDPREFFSSLLGHNGGMTIREAAEADLPEILGAYSASGIGGDQSFTAEEAREQFARLRRYPSYRVFVAEREGRFAGTYALIILDN